MEIPLSKLASLIDNADLELNDAVHEIFDRQAAEVCNLGTDAMIAFLKGNGLTEEEIFKIMEG